ncbi:synergin gamma-like [Ascaphus truei]|uniref:synergin gamma-like n=1 Tax=Ascaphus truei TaxID=8439 RepID=UPI003F5967C9
MDSYIAHQHKCLKNIHRVIKNANDILCGISQPSVCSEVLLSSQGTDYISGVVEVYRVSQRMEGGMISLNIGNERLRLILRDIDLAWNNLQAFLSLCPCVLQMMPPPSALNCKTAGPLSETKRCLHRCCGVCLIVRLTEEQLVTEPTERMLMYEGTLYHPSCANFWLHCVDPSLPALLCHGNCHLCLKPNEKI